MEQRLYIFNFRKLFLFIIKSLLFCGLIIPSAVWLGNTYKQASKENEINRYNKQRFDEFYKNDSQYDLIFIGSSHAYCSFDPKIFDERLGTNSYNMGMPLQLPASTYYELREILSYQDPKTVIMEAYWGVMEQDFQINQVTQLFQVLDNDALKEEYIEKVFPFSEKIKYSVDALKYQSDYFAYKSDEYDEKLRKMLDLQKPAGEYHTTGSESYGDKGFVYCDYELLPGEYDRTNQFRNLDGKSFEFSDEQLFYLDKISTLCREKGVKLIFVTAPIAPVSMDYIKNYDSINQKISDFCKEKGIPYFDYNIINREENLFGNENFRDDAHLNYSGVEIMDNHFIDLLEQKGMTLK